MSHIDDLIEEHCPNGVEFAPLGSVTKNHDSRRRPVTKSNRRPGPFPYYGANGIQDYVDAFIFDGVFLLVGEDGSVTRSDGTPVVNWAEGQIWVNNHAHVLTAIDSTIELRFLYFYLTTVNMRPYVTGGTQPKLNQGNLNQIPIPVPPLEVQREIIRILDTFAGLEVALEAELKSRRELQKCVIGLLPRTEWMTRLSPSEPETVHLGSIATQYVKSVQLKSDEKYVNLGVKWYGEGVFAREPKLGSQIKATRLYEVKPEQFIYNRMFVTEGAFGIVTPDLADGMVSNEFPVYDLDKSRVLPEWLHLKFRDPFVVATVASQATGGTKSRRCWGEKQFEAFRIDLPPLEVQAEIVRIVQQFNDLEATIEGELKARRKQYAYYRDRLLTFAEKPA